MDNIVYIAILHISVMMFVSGLFIAFWLYFYFAYEAISTTQLMGYYVIWAVCGTNFFILGPIAITLLTREIRIKYMTRTTLSLYILLCLASISPTPLLSNMFEKGESTRIYVRNFYLEYGRVPYLMDYIQRYQRCCGYNNYTDYYRSPEESEEDDTVLNEPLPLSCCSEIMVGCEKSFGMTYKQGCFIAPVSHAPVIVWEHPYHGTGFLAVIMIPLVLPLFQFMQMCFLHDAFMQVYLRRKSRRWRFCNDQERSETGAGDATEVRSNSDDRSSNSSSSSSNSNQSPPQSLSFTSVTSTVFPVKLRNKTMAHLYTNDAKSRNSWNSMFINMNLDDDSSQSKDSHYKSDDSWSTESSSSEESSQTFVSVQKRRNYNRYNNDRWGNNKYTKNSGRRSRKEYVYRPSIIRQTGRHNNDQDDNKNTDNPSIKKSSLKSQGNDDKSHKTGGNPAEEQVHQPVTPKEIDQNIRSSSDVKNKSICRSKLNNGTDSLPRVPAVGRMYITATPSLSIKGSVHQDNDQKSTGKSIKTTQLKPPTIKMSLLKESDSNDDQISNVGSTSISVASKALSAYKKPDTLEDLGNMTENNDLLAAIKSPPTQMLHVPKAYTDNKSINTSMSPTTEEKKSLAQKPAPNVKSEATHHHSNKDSSTAGSDNDDHSQAKSTEKLESIKDYQPEVETYNEHKNLSLPVPEIAGLMHRQQSSISPDIYRHNEDHGNHLQTFNPHEHGNHYYHETSERGRYNTHGYNHYEPPYHYDTHGHDHYEPAYHHDTHGHGHYEPIQHHDAHRHGQHEHSHRHDTHGHGHHEPFHRHDTHGHGHHEHSHRHDTHGHGHHDHRHDIHGHGHHEHSHRHHATHGHGHHDNHHETHHY